MTLWCFAIALRECRWRECWAAKLAPEIGSNSPKASATMAILVLGHIVVTPVFGVSALGHKRTKRHVWSALPPCVDGSELARTFLNVCSIGRCSHVFGLFARFT